MHAQVDMASRAMTNITSGFKEVHRLLSTAESYLDPSTSEDNDREKKQLVGMHGSYADEDTTQVVHQDQNQQLDARCTRRYGTSYTQADRGAFVSQRILASGGLAARLEHTEVEETGSQ